MSNQLPEADTSRPPMPLLEGLTAEFYAFCRRGELALQRCLGCANWRHVPRNMCGHCGSASWQWERSSGRGTIYSITKVHRALDPVLQERAPFFCAVVEMVEGVRIVAEVLAHSAGVTPQIGAPVTVQFVDIAENVTLPKFRMIGEEGETRK